MISRLIDRFERRLTRAWQFCADTWYYIGRGYGLRKAIELARDTL